MNCLFTVTIAAAALAAGPQKMALKLTLQNDARMYLPSPAPVRIELSESPPPGAKAVAGALWARLPWGASDSDLLAISLTPQGTSTVARIDLNRNGDPADDAPAEWDLLDAGTASARWEGRWKLPLAGGMAQIVVYRYHPDTAKMRGLSDRALHYFRDYCLVGTAKFTEREVPIRICDEQTRGDFTHPGSHDGGLRIGLDADGNGLLDANREWHPLSGSAAQPGGSQLRVNSIASDGLSAELVVAPPGTRIASPIVGADLAGTNRRMPEDYAGKLVLVSFWGSYCPHCKRELPTIVELQKKYADRKDFAILGVSVDAPTAKKALTDIIEKEKVVWPNLFDGNGWQTPHAKAYGVNSVPKAFLIDTEQMLIVAEGGDLRGPNLIKTVDKHLAARAGAVK